MKYETFCPLFPGFYGTVFEYDGETDDIESYNQEHGTAAANKIEAAAKAIALYGKVGRVQPKVSGPSCTGARRVKKWIGLRQ